VAENLWALREQKKISVATLANRAGLPIGLIMEYESGQRGIDLRHLGRLARALYIEESNIKLQSDPRPGAGPLERQTGRDFPRSAPPAPLPPAPPPPTPAPRSYERPMRSRTEPRGPRGPRPPRPPIPPRPNQIAHLEHVLKRLRMTEAELEAEIGKPIASLDRGAFSTLLKNLQVKMHEAPLSTRHRAYLPESVDEFEGQYLMATQAAGDRLHFVLFDGATVDGVIVGFSPYSITVRDAAGAEITLNKLALVSYRKLAGESVR
jgi:transcriptional regulator with XRE-family HTH domain